MKSTDAEPYTQYLSACPYCEGGNFYDVAYIGQTVECEECGKEYKINEVRE